MPDLRHFDDRMVEFACSAQLALVQVCDWTRWVTFVYPASNQATKFCQGAAMSLNAPYDTGNIFAKILRGEMSCARIYEDDHALAFLDIFPRTPGHTLVIPKLETTNLLTFPTDQFGPFMASVQIVAKAVRAAFNADGLTLLQFNGDSGGQSVFHFHFHVIPRIKGVTLTGHEASPMAAPDVLDQHQKLILAQF
jgi:histidine triad (HIT) family protein